MWYFKFLGGRSVKMPFTGRRPSEHQAPHYFCGECLMAGMVWEGGGGFYTEHLCTRSSNVFNLRRKRFYLLRKHFLGFQKFLQKKRWGQKEGRRRRRRKERRGRKRGRKGGKKGKRKWGNGRNCRSVLKGLWFQKKVLNRPSQWLDQTAEQALGHKSNHTAKSRHRERGPEGFGRSRDQSSKARSATCPLCLWASYPQNFHFLMWTVRIKRMHISSHAKRKNWDSQVQVWAQ